MKLAPQRQQMQAHYMVRAYGNIQAQRRMHQAVKRLEEAMRKWK